MYGALYSKLLLLVYSIYPGQIQDKNEQKNLYLLPYKFRLDKYINAERSLIRNKISMLDEMT